jgi:hypothetical protein
MDKANMRKERPILFSAPMVRAILDGEKTQTRRIVKPRKDIIFGCLLSPDELASEVDRGVMDNSPWRAGDRLWVRETFAIVPRTAYRCSEGVKQTLRPDDDHDAAIYRSGWERSKSGFSWKPSIFMPRWASRITLEIVSVRVELLQEISQEDAIAEGLKGITKDGKLVKYGIPDSDGLPGTDNTGWPWKEWRISPVGAYKKLWESINGLGSWDKNPFVWVIEFKIVRK